MIDPGFSTDNWLTVCGFVAMGVLYVANSRGTNKILATRLEVIDSSIAEAKTEIKEMRKVVVTQSELSSRIEYLNSTVTGTIGAMDRRLLQEGHRIDRLESKLFNIPQMPEV